MNLEITGKLVEKYDTQTVNDRFRKREFVLEVTEEVNGSAFTNFAKMQLVQNKTDIIDRFQIGDSLRVNFSIKGNRYERDGKVSYFSNLDAWRIEKADAAGSNSGGNNNYNAGGNYNNNNNGGGNNWNNGGGNNNGGNWNNNQGNGGNNPAPAFQNTNSGGGNFGSTESADDLPF
jgi:hypothetical protein